MLTSSPAVRLMLFARSLEGLETVIRNGKPVTISRGRAGKFGNLPDGPKMPTVKPEPKARPGSVTKALLSGDPAALDGFNREQLRREAGKRGIALKRGTSADAIKDALWDHERSGVDDEADLPAVEKAELNLARMTVPQLKERAKAEGVKGYSKMRKADLVAALGPPGIEGTPGGTNVGDVMAVIAPMRANPKKGDRERVAELLAPLTVPQLNEVAAAHGITYLHGIKDRRRSDLLHGLVGHKLDTRTIIGGGDWNKSMVPASNQDQTGSLTRRIKQIDEAMDEVDGPAARQLNDTRKALVEQRAALGSAQPQDRVRQAYDKLKDQTPSEWVRMSAIRDELSDLSREEQDAALRELAVQPDIRIAPVANLKSLTPEEKAAAVKLGGEMKHALAIEAPAGTSVNTPKSMPVAPAAKPRAGDLLKGGKAKPNVGDVATQLKSLPISQEGLDQAHAMVAGLSVKELQALAKEIGPTVNAKGNKADLARAIAEGTVGFRLRAAATNPGGSFGQKPDAGRIKELSGMTNAPRATTPAGLGENPAGPAATARRMATMRAREGSAMDVGNSAELQSAVEAEWADWVARTGGKRGAGRPARELGGIKEPASQSDTYVLSHMITNKANLGMRQEQPYFLAVPPDRRGGVMGSIVTSDPDRIPADIKRYFETTVSGDIYENDRETGQRRWIGRVKPEEVLPPLEEGVQELHRRRDPDAGMTEWHNHERPAWWDNSKTWIDDGAAPDEPALVTPSTPAPKRARQLLAARPAAARNEWTALPVAELTSKLSNVTADDEAKVRGALEGRSKAELTAIARQIDTVGSAGSSTANQLIEAIVEGTVGFRARARAMGRS